MADRPPASVANLTPVGPANALARKHGSYREAEVGPLAEALMLEVAEQAPWAARPEFDGEVRALARAQAEAELLWRHVCEVGVVDGKGKPRPALAALHRAETRAAKLRASLGLNPRALTQLLASLGEAGADGDALAAAARAGMEMLRAREVGAGG